MVKIEKSDYFKPILKDNEKKKQYIKLITIKILLLVMPKYAGNKISTSWVKSNVNEKNGQLHIHRSHLDQSFI